MERRLQEEAERAAAEQDLPPLTMAEMPRRVLEPDQEPLVDTAVQKMRYADQAVFNPNRDRAVQLNIVPERRNDRELYLMPPPPRAHMLMTRRDDHEDQVAFYAPNGYNMVPYGAKDDSGFYYLQRKDRDRAYWDQINDDKYVERAAFAGAQTEQHKVSNPLWRDVLKERYDVNPGVDYVARPKAQEGPAPRVFMDRRPAAMYVRSGEGRTEPWKVRQQFPGAGKYGDPQIYA